MAATPAPRTPTTSSSCATPAAGAGRRHRLVGAVRAPRRAPRWQVTALSGTMPPGGPTWCRRRPGAGGTTPLPTPDATGTIAMSATAGKVALVTTSRRADLRRGLRRRRRRARLRRLRRRERLRDRAGRRRCPTPPRRLATPARTPTTTRADFTAGAPTPRNSGGGRRRTRASRACASTTSRAPRTARRWSGMLVADVPGVVTAMSRQRLLDPGPAARRRPGRPARACSSSPRAAPTVAVGDAVTSTGTVAEFRPGGATPTNLSTTELTAPTVTVAGTGARCRRRPSSAPAAGCRRRRRSRTTPPATSRAPACLRPGRATALDFWESLEGMRLQLDDAAVVGPTSGFGELPVVPGRRGSPRTRPRRHRAARRPTPTPSGSSSTTCSAPRCRPRTSATRCPAPPSACWTTPSATSSCSSTATPTVADADGSPREVTAARSASTSWRSATFNVENLDPADPQAKFDALAPGSRDQPGARPDLRRAGGGPGQHRRRPTTASVAADQTLDPADRTRSGRPAARRTTGARSTRTTTPTAASRAATSGSRSCSAPTADCPSSTVRAATATAATGRRAAGSASRGCRCRRAGSTRPTRRGSSSRKPLAGEFRWRGQAGLRGRQPLQLQGRRPAAVRPVPAADARRPRCSGTQQARLVRAFVDQILGRRPAAPSVDRARRPQRLRVLRDRRHPGRRRRAWSTCRGRCRQPSATPTSSRATRRCSTTS